MYNLYIPIKDLNFLFCKFIFSSTFSPFIGIFDKTDLMCESKEGPLFLAISEPSALGRERDSHRASKIS